jgi:anaerobic selenocysteine-containing dehydrogenase
MTTPLKRRDFLKAAAATVGVGFGLSALRSFVPEVHAGEPLPAARWDQVPVVNGDFAAYPPFERWGGWRELDGEDWKGGGVLRREVKVRDYVLVPTICNNCEALCGLTAWVDKETLTVRKYMGNPLHTGSKGRNCAKGYAVQSQMYDPDRIPFPLKRAPGTRRGEGRWVRASWDEALAEIGAAVRAAITSGDPTAKKSVMHHVGRPNESGFTPRVWASLGQDCQNSHTNICSAGARFGSLAWVNDDRSAPDWEHARLVFLQSSHAADAGHYFQQAAGQISAARKQGAKLVVLDPRLSNSAGIADLWVPIWPGTEAALYLALGGRLLREGRYDREFVRTWWNWQDLLDDDAELQLLVDRGFLKAAPAGKGFDDFEALLVELYGAYDFEWAATECRVPRDTLERLYELVVWAGDQIASFFWRASGAGHRGGWMSSSRAGIFLLALTGNFGGVGALSIEEGRVVFLGGKGHAATVGGAPPKITEWNELSWPPEWPLASYEPSYLLPHLLSDPAWQEKWRSQGLTVPSRLAVWFGRQYNPVWINPDGFRWIEVLKDESKIGLTVNPSPTWSETNWFMDWILPVGLSGERHDQHSEPTTVDQYFGFRQPVLRVALEKSGWEPQDPSRATLEAHRKAGLGEVWEENELWVALAFAIDPDGSLGIRKFWESKRNPGKPVTMAEYYDAAFSTLPGLKAAALEAAAAKVAAAKTDLEQKLAAAATTFPCYDLLRDRGAWREKAGVYKPQEEELHAHGGKLKARPPIWYAAPVELDEASLQTDERTGQITAPGPDGRFVVGVRLPDGRAVTGFATPSRKMDFYAKWMSDWGWPEYAVPIYPRTVAQRAAMIHVVSQVHHSYMTEDNAFALNPIFRLSYNIHTRSVNSKWLMEISQNHNPLWINPRDAGRLGLEKGAGVKLRVVDTLSGLEAGWFVAMCMPTEGIAPGVLACSHHSGRWRVVSQVPVEGFERPLGIMGLGAPVVELGEQGTTRTMRTVAPITPMEVEPTTEFGPTGWPFAEFNRDLGNISWDGLSGVWQNAVHHPHPDPISAMHCWHQKVLLEPAGPNDKIGDLSVDLAATFATYQRWRDDLTRPAPGPGGLRRPEHLKRPWVALTREAYQMKRAT